MSLSLNNNIGKSKTTTKLKQSQEYQGVSPSFILSRFNTIPYVTPQEPPEPMVLVPPDVLAQSPQVNALEALLEGSSNFHAMLDMPPDADDERMVELAIALSLQEQSGGHSGGLSLQAMHLGGHQQVEAPVH